MPIPVVALDQQQTILARPRNAPIYDTEGMNDGVAVPSTLSFFVNLTTFQVANLSQGPSKVFGRDTNLEGTPGGAIPKGSMFLWYDLTAPVSWRQVYAGSATYLSAPANVGLFEEVQRIRRSLAFTFYFADTPYFSEPLEAIPMGVGVDTVMTTVTGSNVFPIKNGRLHRDNRRRATVAGYPVGLTHNEQFSIDYNCYSDFNSPATVSAELYWSPTLHGLFLKGLQG